MDIGRLIPATLPQIIAEIVKVVDIGLLIPATLSQLITEVVDVVQFYPDIITLVIAEYMLIEVDLSHKIPDTLTLTIW